VRSVCGVRLARANERDANDDADARDAHPLAAAEKCTTTMRDVASASAPEIEVMMEEIDEETHGVRGSARVPREDDVDGTARERAWDVVR